MQSLSWSIRRPPRLLLALVLAVVLTGVALATASMVVGGKPTIQAHKEGDTWPEDGGKECTKQGGRTYCGEVG